MKSEWREYKIGDYVNMEFQKTTLGELSIGGRGMYGIAASAVPYNENLFTYLRITDINDNGTLNKSGFMSVDDEKAVQYLLKPNDIVFARTGGSTGRNYFYDSADGEFVFAGFLIKFSIDETKVNPRFIKYYCLSQEYKGWVHSFNTGSTRGNINAQTYAKMPIVLPPKKQQDLLVDTLSVIDEKIKINTSINNNLPPELIIYSFQLLGLLHSTINNGNYPYNGMLFVDPKVDKMIFYNKLMYAAAMPRLFVRQSNTLRHKRKPRHLLFHIDEPIFRRYRRSQCHGNIIYNIAELMFGIFGQFNLVFFNNVFSNRSNTVSISSPSPASACARLSVIIWLNSSLVI